MGGGSFNASGNLTRRQSRVTQTLTALAGCEVLLGLCTLPLVPLLDLGGGMRDLAAMFWLFLLGWNIAIAAHLFRQSLEVRQGVGLLFGVAYIMISISLSSFLVPVEVAG